VKLNDKTFYENFWAGYSSDLALQLAVHTESRRPLHKLLERLIPPDRASSFLEVGCGTALDTCLLAARRPSARAVAMDLSCEAMAVAQRYAAEMGVSVELLAGDLRTLPFADGEFDLVFSQGVLEHFADPLPCVREQTRVLRPGGVLLVDVPQKFNWYTVIKHRAMRAGVWPWGWETEYSAGDLRAWAPRASLEVIGIVGHQHGKIVDRLLIHPHRLLRNKLAQRRGRRVAVHYTPGRLARAWENAWDWLDSVVGPYMAINVAVAYRKSELRQASDVAAGELRLSEYA
jgi:SAM-dependent methyltransferase